MAAGPKIDIETPRERKDKLIKWYGWITITVLCLTPLVLILLPVLMVNTSKIGRILRESRVPGESSLVGTVKKARWELKNEIGLDSIVGELEIEKNDQEIISCTFLKYVGESNKELPEIKEGDKIEAIGKFNEQENKFAVKNIRNVSTNRIYTSEPALAVY
ncbi:hypothetical protein JOC37_001244 [Desulfohalotomaculum tongense]|uniref:hypothetical protein n=1 Tax=Desulforadius tongensis TaxID=1216062 RepID=UPI00195B443F|nr:hypothetical protein [Desulforadius tongensis]MBM7854866.1 hypothetical protein [Desulforadius tongensis]